MPHSPYALEADFFDGVHAQPQRVRLRCEGEWLLIEGEGLQLRWPLAEVDWPERTRHGARSASRVGAGMLQCLDGAAWDAWAQASGVRDGWVARWQQSWRAVLGAVLGLVLLLVLLYRWGLPWAVQAALPLVPTAVDQAVGEHTLKALDGHWFAPSALGAQAQQRVQAAARRVLPPADGQDNPGWELLLRRSQIGPNAVALPGGTSVMTDEMVELVQGDEAALAAILAHEWGHLRQRHGMRMLAQATALGLVAGLVLGDASSLLATVPVLLGQAQYSRQAEREADALAVQRLRAAGLSPAAMLTLFERLHAQRRAKNADSDSGQEGGWIQGLGIAFASHPADEERMEYFRQAAAGSAGP